MRTTKKDSKKQKQLLEKKLDKAWSEYIRNRDNVCKKCGGKGSVSPHHAFGRRHMATRWDVNNGVGLCYPCHIHWAHRDPSGFSVWFERHIGETNFDNLRKKHLEIVKYGAEELQTMLDWFWKESGNV